MKKFNHLAKVIVFFFLIIAGACKQDYQSSQFSYILQKKLINAIEIKELAIQKTTLTRPSKANVEVLSFLNLKGECFALNYQIPSRKDVQDGKLILLKGCEKQSDDKLNKSVQMELAYLNELSEISFSLSNKLQILGKERGEKLKLEYPLFNIRRPKKLDLLSNSSLNFYKEGLVVTINQPLAEVSVRPDVSESYFEKTAKTCHVYNKFCEEVEPNTCSNCVNGWFSVIGKNACGIKTTKYCGVDNCGQKGWPACPRFPIPDRKEEIICFDNSPYVFCEKDLNIYCVNDELICL